jgi:hypothetical protein
MFLLFSGFYTSDFLVVPICFVTLLMIFSAVIKKYYKHEDLKRLFFRAFIFKMLCTIAYTMVAYMYYDGADTEMYLHCTQNLHRAVTDDINNLAEIYTTKTINVKTPLMNYFIFTESRYPVFEAMHEPGNFMVPKLALPFSLLFGGSYVCIAMVFSFFALGGAIRLFKVLYHYFPQYYREIAFATLFIPSAGFWSAGLMKDPICFGAVGYIVYAMFNIFVKKRQYFWSIVWIVVCSTLLYFMKVYILLALLPAVVLWLFSAFNRLVENKTLGAIMAVITFAVGGVIAVFLLNYATSDESLKSFSFDTLSETSATQRALYEGYDEKYEGSYYSVGSSNPAVLLINGIVATFFRPFIWEINGPTALLSAVESLFFLFLTILLMYKKGVINFFRNAFRQPILLMCIIFSLVFAAAVGSTALNFGSLSRYKIPCLPFYMALILILYRQANLSLPQWFNNMLGYRQTFRPEKKPI